MADLNPGDPYYLSDGPGEYWERWLAHKALCGSIVSSDVLAAVDRLRSENQRLMSEIDGMRHIANLAIDSLNRLIGYPTDYAGGERYELGLDIDLDEEIVRDRNGDRITEERAQEIASAVLTEARRQWIAKHGDHHA